VITKTYDGVVGCSPGEDGCTLVTHTTTLPPATVSGTFTCATPGPNGWCLGGGALNLSANEPVAGYVITLIENDTGTLCDPPDAASVSCTWDQGADGNYVIEFWAHSSRGDTSAKGSAIWRQDTTGPVSQFTEPLEGSTTPASGVVSLSGTSVDTASGAAGAEIWVEGAGAWQPLEVVGGAWSTTWDTTTVTDGTYFVQVRAIDLVGNLGETAQVFLTVDNEAPVNAPAPRATDEAHPHAVAEVQHPDGTDTYTYDASGSQTQRTEDGVTYNQTVDGEGQLVAVQNTTSGETWTFTYDGDGNRIRQVNPDGTTTLFLVGGLYEVTLDAGGQQTAVKRYYAIGGQPIALRDAGGTFYLLTDHLGSVVAVLDATGAVVGEQRYRPFGQPRLTPGITQTDRGYTGQQSLTVAGLQDFNARWFDTSLGMFSSPDNLIPDPFDAQALGRYTYVLNNPLRYVDPTGQKYCDSDSPDDCTRWSNSIEHVARQYHVSFENSTSVTDRSTVLRAVEAVASKLAEETGLTETAAFREVYGLESGRWMVFHWGVDRTGLSEECSGITSGACTSSSTLVNIVSFWGAGPNRSSGAARQSSVYTVVHELGHAFGNRLWLGNAQGESFRLNDSLVEFAMDRGRLPDRPFGYLGEDLRPGTWQQSVLNTPSENFADMYLGWTFGQWAPNAYGQARADLMESVMPSLLTIALAR